MWIIENPRVLKILDWNPADYVRISNIGTEAFFGTILTKEDYDLHCEQHLEKFGKRNQCKLYGAALEEFVATYQRNYMRAVFKARHSSTTDAGDNNE